MSYPSVATLSPPSIVDKTNILHTANCYLCDTLGNQYRAIQPVQTKLGWQCLIQFCATEGKRVIVGQIDVDEKTGDVIPLSPATCREMQERAVVRLAKEKGAVARDEHGYILPYLAKIKVNGYLTDTITMFASAEGAPTWHDGDEPYWRVKISLQLRGYGIVTWLGHIDVNAVTGAVVPLPDEQIISIQKRADYVAANLPRSAETPS